jgi:epoxyqueuosine reductase
VALREAVGNRIYGCDDCQLVCPWNKYAAAASLPDFASRNRLDAASLVELFAWDRADFETRFEGSAIRRIGHERWLRNVAVAAGNALRQLAPGAEREALARALQARSAHPSDLVQSHVAWALAQPN